MSYTEFNARSAFSFLHGASLPETLVQRAAELGHPSIAITDPLGFYASPRAHSSAKSHNIRAHVGTLIPISTQHFLPLLAATHHGYSQLCQQLTSIAGVPPQNHNSSPLPSQPSIANYHFTPGSVIALSGDHDSQLCQLLLHGKKKAALAFTQQLVSAFGKNNLYLQITRHHLRHETQLNRLLIDLSEHLQLPLLATNAPLHARRSERLLCDAFTCLRHHTTLDQAGALLAPNSERHLKSPRQMRELFADLPQAISNTQRLAERLEFTLEHLGYRFPDAHDESNYPLSLPEQATQLRRHTYHGAFRRYRKLNRKIKQQLEHELALIQKLGFQGYFLIVHEIINFAKAHGIFCQGRGSAANSAVCYALGITQVDPIGGGLLFERFLSENRRSWPDIDIDFPSGTRRELVIQHIFEKFGSRGAAMTANVITYRPRSAFREMSKILGFPSTEFHPPSPNTHSPPSTTSHLAQTLRIPENHPRLPALIHLYQAVLTLPRHLGQHSGGMIICDRGLDSIVPLQPATMPGRTIVQWDKDDCADLGIVKVDILGLGMLAAIEETLQLCQNRGHPVDPATLPKDDPAVYQLLCRADTIGTFQVESRAQIATLPIMKPKNFYDLAIEIAIIRPGPIVGDLLHPYLNRRQGIHKPDCIHPSLEPILKRTLGVPLFQEQVLRMAMTLADFDGAEADQLRRAMAFKRADEKMEAISHKLRQRMSEKGIPTETQQKVIQSIGSFALYGFPESHAISFALIAYLSCWLKAHRPAEFYCGLINNQPMGFYSVNTLIEDAKRHHIHTRPISVTHSDYSTTVIDSHHLQLGLKRLKGFSNKSAQRLIQQRKTVPFSSLTDFLTRLQIQPAERRLLAASGALNGLPDIRDRRDALWQSELPLFDDLLAPQPSPTPLPPMTEAERLATDITLTGSTTGSHPMQLLRQKYRSSKRADYRQLATTPRAIDLPQLRHGTPLSICGMIICRQRPSTAKGHCFITLEDETGISNLFVPRDTFEHHRLLITTEAFIQAQGRLQLSETATLYVTHLSRLPATDHSPAPHSHDFH